MTKLKKWCLGIIVCSIAVIIFVSLLPETDQQKKVNIPKDQVKLNYKDQATVTHQQIISVIKENVASELTLEDYDCRLKKVEIKDKKISVYLDLQFRPLLKSWVIREGKAWLGYVAVLGFTDDEGNLIGNVYSTGYDISISMWTWFEEDGSEVLPWGHATIFNSGKPFTEHSVSDEGKWSDSSGMKMLK